MTALSEETSRKTIHPNWIALFGVLGILLLFGYLGSVLLARPGCFSESSQQKCIHILFVGNSFTSTNDLPDVFARLAKAGGYPVDAQTTAKGGWTLEQHASSVASIKSIQSQPWDYVVLQEQSQIPATHRSRAYSMYPAVKTLSEIISEQKSSPLLMQTWAHRSGWAELGMPDYESMQAEVDAGYREISDIFNIPVVPVGDAWFTEWKNSPGVNLWQSDGVHPTPVGTYLAACVFYAKIFQKSPVGLNYTGGLSIQEAEEMQNIAALVVLGSSQ